MFKTALVVEMVIVKVAFKFFFLTLLLFFCVLVKGFPWAANVTATSTNAASTIFNPT